MESKESKQSIKDIKDYLNTVDIKNIPVEIKKFRADERKGVQNVVLTFEKKYQNYLNEIERVKKLNSYENAYYEQGLTYIAGVDEVGRGPLAGPVVACCVILPPNTFIEGINDSKKISEPKREIIFEQIKNIAIDYGIGVVDSKIIDEINILQATYQAMRIAISNMKTIPDILLNDAVSIPEVNIVQHPIIHGDALSISIAAASILAKVTRDRMMIEYGKKYSHYDFASNKGYGTQNHLDGLKNHGLTEIHRKSFLKNMDLGL